MAFKITDGIQNNREKAFKSLEHSR